MTEESKNELESELYEKIESYKTAVDRDYKIELLKEINSLRKLLEEIEKHEQEISLKEARIKIDEKKVQNEVDKFLHECAKNASEEQIEKQKIEIEREKIEIEKQKSLREEKTNKRDFWLRVASIAVPAIGGLIQIGVGYLQYCGITNMIYKESERPTPELKDTIKYCQKAIFRSK